METYELASLIIMLSVGIGLVASATIPEMQQDELEREEAHAQFHIVFNGSEVPIHLLDSNVSDVYIEEGETDIVRRNTSGATWNRFLESIDTEYWRSNSTGNLCLKVARSERCGDGAVYLNGEPVEDLEREIEQDDHLLIILDSEEEEQIVEEYMKMQLPQQYKPPAIQGKQV